MEKALQVQGFANILVTDTKGQTDRARVNVVCMCDSEVVKDVRGGGSEGADVREKISGSGLKLSECPRCPLHIVSTMEEGHTRDLTRVCNTAAAVADYSKEELSANVSESEDAQPAGQAGVPARALESSYLTMRNRQN